MKQSKQTASAIALNANGANQSDSQTSSRGELRKDAFLQSLEKGIAVLEAFSFDHPYQTIAEIAEKTNQDRATARRALLTLVQMGYLRHDGKRFALTARVLGFGYQYLAALPFWAQCHPVLEELSDELNETVSIGVLDRDDVVFILRVPAKRLLTFDPSTGSRVPAHVHSIGHILLASWPESELEAFLARVEFTKFTANTVERVEDLRNAITAAREQGWAFASSQHEENLGGISIPLRNRGNRVIAALNVNFIMDSDAERKALGSMLPRLQLAARRIQESMTSDGFEVR